MMADIEELLASSRGVSVRQHPVVAKPSQLPEQFNSPMANN